MREIQPDIILTQSPQDYMEDHQNTVRLVVTAAFARGHDELRDRAAAPRRTTDRWRSTTRCRTACSDGLRQAIEPHFYVDITGVLARKRAMLACHASRKSGWMSARAWTPTWTRWSG